ncbi:hypothetical protein E2C01_021577 [Portunus trituberculatus]|uniref:Uncharacterized protein n=1 Tax=Portunus trituberculatus TaxID=210409 RepID=A0A5B7E6G8_PORTR|nr:hypothetical protein [Portunus trituberculatus]
MEACIYTAKALWGHNVFPTIEVPTKAFSAPRFMRTPPTRRRMQPSERWVKQGKIHPCLEDHKAKEEIKEEEATTTIAPM